MFALRWDPDYGVMRQRRRRVLELRYPDRPQRRTGIWVTKTVWEVVPSPSQLERVPAFRRLLIVKEPPLIFACRR